jgi:hypothetical protein
MKLIKYKFIFLAFAVFAASDLFAQAQNPAMPDSSNIYLGEAIGRSQIDVSELPEEVAGSIEASEYGDMNMVAIYKVDIVPGKETTTDSIINKSINENESSRPYRMRNDNLSLNETYYQDTYNDLQKEELDESTAQENVTDADKTDGLDTSTEDQVSQSQIPDNVEVYYEVEVNGKDKAEGYVLLFDANGQLTHTIPQDM